MSAPYPMTLANVDQAMRALWEKVRKENPDLSERSLIHRAMKEAYRLAEAKEELKGNWVEYITMPPVIVPKSK